MFKSIYRNVFKILSCVVLFFSCVGIVNANFFDTKGGKDVYINCTDSEKCIPLCVYKDNNGNDVGLIGYYYGSDTKWEIAFMGGRATGVNNIYNIYFKISGDLVHGDDIYDPSVDKAQDWVNKDLYNNLKNKYSCPSRMYIDEALYPSYNELCFENSGGNCSKFNGAGTSFTPYTLSYNFASEYNDVMISAYQALNNRFSNDTEEVNKEKIKFLSVLVSGGYQYDDSASAKDNALLNCGYLKQNASGKYADYIKAFAKNESYFKNYLDNYLNSSIKNAASSHNVRNLSIYDYSTLSKMMKSKSVAIYEGGNSEDKVGPIIDFFSLAYNKNVKESINYIYNICNDYAHFDIDLRVDTDNDGVPDSDNMNDIVDSERESFDIRIFADPKIEGLTDPDSLTYDCSFLTDIADVISTGYFIIEMIGLAILVIFTSMDYIKIFLNDNADDLKKANSNFLKRLIIAVILFLLPALVNFSLRIFKIEGINSEHPLCVQISNK